jgi:hypothetical protein
MLQPHVSCESSVLRRLRKVNVFEGYNLPRRSEHQAVPKPLQIGAAKQVAEKLTFV